MTFLRQIEITHFDSFLKKAPEIQPFQNILDKIMSPSISPSITISLLKNHLKSNVSPWHSSVQAPLTASLRVGLTMTPPLTGKQLDSALRHTADTIGAGIEPTSTSSVVMARRVSLETIRVNS